MKRPIINTRDEPHADPEKYRRLHVIIGDANMAEVSTYLKVGTTALVLAMIEDRYLTRDLGLETPVASLRAISHDPGCTELVTLMDGRKLTAVQLQMEYLELARKYVAETLGDDVDAADPRRAGPLGVGADRARDRPDACATELDWVAKLRSSSGTATGTGSSGTDAKLHLIDLQYADIRPEKGLYHRLAGRGRIERLLDDATIEAAMHDPPEDTRAYFRAGASRSTPTTSPPRRGTR